MPFALNPFDSPTAWDTFYVGGNLAPGLARVKGAGLRSEFDKKRGKGARGATLTYTGIPANEFKVQLRFWTRQHFADWDLFLPLLKYDPSKKAIQAVDVSYPALLDVGVTSAVCEFISQIEMIDEDKKIWAVELEFCQYLKPTANAVGTPTTSSTSTTSPNAKPTGTPVPTAQDAQQAEIDRLLKQAMGPT
jgi:hypothetical protein